MRALLVNPYDTQPGRDVLPELDYGGETLTINRKSLLELANIAMNELIMHGQMNSALWKIDSSSKRETFGCQEKIGMSIGLSISI